MKHPTHALPSEGHPDSMQLREAANILRAYTETPEAERQIGDMAALAHRLESVALTVGRMEAELDRLVGDAADAERARQAEAEAPRPSWEAPARGHA